MMTTVVLDEEEKEKKSYKLDSGVTVTMTDLKFDDVKVADYSNNSELPWSIVETTNENKDKIYANHNTFTLHSTIGRDDINKIMESFSPGKPTMFSGKIDNFSINVSNRCDGTGKTVTTKINGNDVTFDECKLKLEFPSFEPDGDLLTLWDSSTVVHAEGPIRRGGGGVVMWSPESHLSDPFQISERRNIAKAINLEKIMEETKKLKKKNHHWITFQQVTGHWNKTVKAALKGDRNARAKMQDLGNRMVCIMGQAWHGENWGGKKGCSMCEYLGYDALRIFTGPQGEHFYTPISMELFNHYKLAFEHHWNTAHADHTRN